MKAIFITAIASLALLTTGCMEQNKKEPGEKELQAIFPKGELGLVRSFLMERFGPEKLH